MAVRTAADVIGYDIAGIWLREDDRLELAAQMDAAVELFDDPPTYTEGNSLSWQAYSSGEPIVVEDLKDDARRYNSDTPSEANSSSPCGGTAF